MVRTSQGADVPTAKSLTRELGRIALVKLLSTRDEELLDQKRDAVIVVRA
jgi:hypothetical protein